MTPQRRRSPREPEPAPADQDRGLAQAEAELETYKKTLAEIYALYDKKIEELSLIRRVGNAIRSPLDLETLCRGILDAVVHEISADRLLLLVAEGRPGAFRVRASFDTSEDAARFHDDAAPPADSPHLAAVADGAPVLRAADTLGFPPFWEAGTAADRFLLPLVARQRIVGVMALERPAGHGFDDEEARILAIISDQAATALDNVRLMADLARANRELTESERQARQTSRYLESLLETANDVIFTVGPDGRITYANRKVGDWGYDKAALIGRPLTDLAADTGRDTALARRLETFPGQVFEAAFRTESGERRDALLSVSHMDWEKRREGAWLVLARDITERKHLERQLFHSEKLASIGILAAGVAHEIGNPLSAISGYAQILKSGGLAVTEADEFLAAILDQSGRIQRIIEELLSYSRPSAGVRSDIRLADAVPQILSMLATQKAFRLLDLEVDLDPGLPPVPIDRDHLAQVVINIALNAAQAMPDGGRLGIRGGRAGDFVTLTMADNGPGIPEADLPRIFDPFFTTKPAGQGTGLGLAICQRIAESYGGALTVDSTPGRGTAFTLQLPAAPQEG